MISRSHEDYYNLIPLEEAQDLIIDSVSILEPIEVSVSESLGLVLAEDIQSSINIPDFDNSSVDGYAVIISDLNGASVDNPIELNEIGEIPAGSYPDFELTTGNTVRIMTGAPIPKGAEAVVIREAVETNGLKVIFKTCPSAGENIRPVGNDIRKKERLYKRGHTIHPPDIGVFSAIIKKKVAVYPKPKIGVLSTGAEITSDDIPPAKGKIKDTNRPTLISFLSYHNYPAEDLGMVIDDPEHLGEKLRKIVDLDVLITNGGVSAGDYDYIPRILEKLGGSIFFHRVRVKPGMPFMFGKLGKTFIFGLPGNPQSAIVGFHLFVLPALEKISGFGEPYFPNMYSGTLSEAVVNSSSRPLFLPARRESILEIVFIHPTGKTSSGALSGFSNADCIVIIPPKSKLHKGHQIQYFNLYEKG